MSLSVSFIIYDHNQVSLQLLCIAWDAKRICRLSLIFWYLLRPEMMVIYTYNIIYGFFYEIVRPSQVGIHANHSKPAYHAKHTKGKIPPHVIPSIPPNHGISRHSLSILSNQNTHSHSSSPPIHPYLHHL